MISNNSGIRCRGHKPIEQAGRLFKRLLILICVGKYAAVAAIEPDGEALFQQRCATCHLEQVNMGGGGSKEAGSQVNTGAPVLSALQSMPFDRVVRAMEDGVMRMQARGLSMAQRLQIASYLNPSAGAGVKPVAESKFLCEGKLPQPEKVLWGQWGKDQKNSRSQTLDTTEFSATTTKSLRLRWAFAFPRAARARSQPAVTDLAIYTGSQDGTVFALDPNTGCEWWRFQAQAEVRNAIFIETDEAGKPVQLYFGDFDANVYALDTTNGELSWKVSLSEHPNATITGSVTAHEGRLFVPLSSTEIVNAYSEEYECCTFRGGVAALDTRSGKLLWRFYTTDKPEVQGTSSKGTKQYGPSGAPVWNTPTIDAKRKRLYFGTGENYSSPANELSDAIIALDLATGDELWVQQTVPEDAWNAGCLIKNANCPIEDGPDFDFGAPVILHTLENGRDLLLAGQKSGMVYAMDPDDKGRIMWQQRAGMGGFNGGVHWGMAVGENKLFVGIADTPGHDQTTGAPNPGLHTFALESGKLLWQRPLTPSCEDDISCFPAISAAVTYAGGVVFAGGLSGHLTAFDAGSGETLWTTETNREFATVNGVTGKGGSIDSDGAVIADGLLLINSGYDKFGHIPGNVLLAFELAGDTVNNSSQK